MLNGETFSSEDAGATAKESALFSGNGGCFFPLILYFSGLTGTGGGNRLGTRAPEASVVWGPLSGPPVVVRLRGALRVGETYSCIASGSAWRVFVFRVKGRDGRAGARIGGRFLALCSRVGDVGRLVREGGTGGGVLEFPDPFWGDGIRGGAGDWEEFTRKVGATRVNTPMDCGRCRRVG